MKDISELSDIQSESGVIGTLIYHPEYILHTDYLQPGYFYNVENSCIYWSIRELYNDGVTNIDAFNISNKLQSHPGVQKTIERYNMPSIQEMIDLYKEAVRNSLEEYKMLVNNIVTLAFKRDLIKSLNTMRVDCFNPDIDLDKLNESVYKELDSLTEKYLFQEEVHTLGEEIDDIWDEIVDRRNDDGSYGIPSKFDILTKYFTYEPGELVVLQANRKEGKSAFLLNETVHKLKNGIPTIVVDTEMRKPTYVSRLISHLTGIEVNRVKRGNYNDEEAKLIEKWRAWIKKQKFVYIYDPDMTMQKLYSICKVLKRQMGLAFVVYDYIKSNEKSTGDNYNVLGAMCDYLKNKIAGELDLSVVTAAQLNRSGEVADSMKINNYLSVAVKWGYKPQEMIAKDGVECGNMYAKIYLNRLGEAQQIDDDEDYLDFVFSGSNMTIKEAKQHNVESAF